MPTERHTLDSAFLYRQGIHIGAIASNRASLYRSFPYDTGFTTASAHECRWKTKHRQRRQLFGIPRSVLDDYEYGDNFNQALDFVAKSLIRVSIGRLVDSFFP